MLKELTLSEPGQSLLLFQHSLPPAPPLPCWDSRDWTGQTVGQKYESQAWLGFPKVGNLRLWIKLLWQRTGGLTLPYPQFPQGSVDQDCCWWGRTSAQPWHQAVPAQGELWPSMLSQLSSTPGDCPLCSFRSACSHLLPDRALVSSHTPCFHTCCSLCLEGPSCIISLVNSRWSLRLLCETLAESPVLIGKKRGCFPHLPPISLGSWENPATCSPLAQD